MFINCKHCGSLVATDPATDLPPERCPRCRGVLRSPVSAPQVSVASLLRSAPTHDAAAPPTIEPDAPATTVETAEPAELPLRATEPAPPPAAPEEVRVATPAAAAPIAKASDSRAPDPAADVRERETPDAPTLPVAAQPLSAPAATPPTASRASPSFARRGGQAPRDARLDRQRRLLVAAVVALSLVLGLQMVIADRVRLASDPGWRPALSALCSVLRCGLPPWREPAALTLLARDVRPDPTHAGRLLAVATFRNDARWAQAWPRLRLTLSDIHGQTVGTRVFAAEDYLDAAPDTPTLPAGESANVRLQLIEPDGRAVSFAFDFL